MCIKAFKVLNCKDISRIDIRLDAQGKPHFLEINTVPGLNPKLIDGSYYTTAAYSAGISHE